MFHAPQSSILGPMTADMRHEAWSTGPPPELGLHTRRQHTKAFAIVDPMSGYVLNNDIPRAADRITPLVVQQPLADARRAASNRKCQGYGANKIKIPTVYRKRPLLRNLPLHSRAEPRFQMQQATSTGASAAGPDETSDVGGTLCFKFLGRDVMFDARPDAFDWSDDLNASWPNDVYLLNTRLQQDLTGPQQPDISKTWSKVEWVEEFWLRARPPYITKKAWKRLPVEERDRATLEWHESQRRVASEANAVNYSRNEMMKEGDGDRQPES